MFDNTKLAVMAYAQNNTQWNYITMDRISEVETPGYFNEANRLIFVGDRITVINPLYTCTYVVIATEKNVVLENTHSVKSLHETPIQFGNKTIPQATPQATPQPIKENLATIIAWHTETFPHATYDGQIKKFEEEMEEYLSANTQQDKLEELADLIIVCCGIARFSTTDGLRHIAQLPFNFTRQEIDDAVQAKMIKNRQRKWTKGDGQYRHVD